MTDMGFDAEAKEAALRTESEAWDTSRSVDAEPGDIAVIDVSSYLESRSRSALEEVAEQLAHACETVGFWQLVGHGIEPSAIANAFSAATDFHALPTEVKEQVRMDRPDWPLAGVGHLPVGNRKLPARSTGNHNEAFIIKSDSGIEPGDNQWLTEDQLPGFRTTVEAFGRELERLALDLLPIYATALGLEPDWFTPGFEHPFWRLRMTRYPADVGRKPDGPTGSGAREATMSDSADVGRKSRQQYGINPHVDTTFFTLLLQDSPGLTIFHTPKQQWINVPLVQDAFVVNSGELLRQWSNDRYLSVRHFANAVSTDHDRYSIPFFFNATRDYPMECIPTCCDTDNPAKYPTISYNESQGVVQGE